MPDNQPLQDLFASAKAAVVPDSGEPQAKIKKMAPMWMDRHPVESADDFHDLDQRAAINEYHHKMPRLDAEQHAHGDYMKERHARAAAHHLAGMKAAQGGGNMDEAKKHHAMYSLHAQALGLDPNGPVPDPIRIQAEAPDRVPVYRFQAHPADMFLSQVLGKSEGDEPTGISTGPSMAMAEGEYHSDVKWRKEKCSSCGNEGSTNPDAKVGIKRQGDGWLCTNCSGKLGKSLRKLVVTTKLALQLHQLNKSLKK